MHEKDRRFVQYVSEYPIHKADPCEIGLLVDVDFFFFLYFVISIYNSLFSIKDGKKEANWCL